MGTRRVAGPSMGKTTEKGKHHQMFYITLKVNCNAVRYFKACAKNDRIYPYTFRKRTKAQLRVFILYIKL